MSADGGNRVRARLRAPRPDGRTHPDARRRTRVRGWARELSAALAAGLVVLAAGLFVAWAMAAAAGEPGPGAAALLGHLAGAVAAVEGYRVSRCRRDPLGRAATVTPFLVLVLLGLLFWWS